MSAKTSTPSSHKVIVVSNAFVNARFRLGIVEMRLLLAMLVRIGQHDKEFQEMHIPLKEIVGTSGRRLSQKDYQQLELISARLAKQSIHVQPLHDKQSEKQSATLDFDKVPLLLYVRYQSGRGFLRVRFSNEVQPYLLQLNQSFTQAKLTQLLKLKSTFAHRIYLLLKQYADFGKRLIDVDELKKMLSLEGQYKQFPMFCLRILDRAQQELRNTDLPFSYEVVGESRGIKRIKFLIQTQPTAVAEPIPERSNTGTASPANVAVASCEDALREIGLATSSLATLTAQLRRGQLLPAYVQFVIKRQRVGYAAGTVKNLAGAVFAAISRRQFVKEFEEQKKVRQQRVQPAGTQHHKIQGLLEEARNSLAFILSHYKGEELYRFEGHARADIARYEAQLLGTR